MVGDVIVVVCKVSFLIVTKRNSREVAQKRAFRAYVRQGGTKWRDRVIST